MKKKIPKFKSENEEARFWATHSPLEYLADFGDVKKPFKFDPALLHKAAERQAERKRFLTLRIGERQIDLAKVIAKGKGLGYQTQMRMWIIEGIHKEMEKHPNLFRFLNSK